MHQFRGSLDMIPSRSLTIAAALATASILAACAAAPSSPVSPTASSVSNSDVKQARDPIATSPYTFHVYDRARDTYINGATVIATTSIDVQTFVSDAPRGTLKVIIPDGDTTVGFDAYANGYCDYHEPAHPVGGGWAFIEMVAC
jgi:hypothetical protein